MAAKMVRPASVRLAERLSVGPLALGLGLAAALLAGLMLLLAASGDLARIVSGEGTIELGQDFRVGIVLAVMLAFLPAVELFAIRRAQRALDELAPVLELAAEELDAHRLALARVSRARNLRAGVIGATVVMGVFLPEAIVEPVFDPRLMGALHIAHRVMAAVLGFQAGASVRLAVRNSRRLGRWAAESGQLDLLDPTAWAPLARVGLGNAFVSMGVISLLLLLVPDRDAGVGLAGGLALLIAASLVMGGMGLVLPLLPVRARIRAVKQAELARCNRRIAELRRASAAAGELADAIAYRGLVDGVSEWPIDVPQLGRFALVFGLPLASWIAAALVERLIDTAFG
jgi:hypothetical protein